MTSKERIQTVLDGGVPDQVPFQDAYWATTIERWRAEGLPADVSPQRYFGCEMARMGGNYSLQFPQETLEKTDRYHVYKDDNGATRKDLNTADGWTPGWLDFSIKNRDDWHRLKDRATYNPSRISSNLLNAYNAALTRNQFIVFSTHACFHPTWHKIGMENLLIWMLEDPDLIADMFATHTQLIIDLFDGAKALGLTFDGAWLSDDLGYCTAPLISPDLYRDLVLPNHKRLCDHFARNGLKTFLHSDGNIAPLIPHFLEAGFGVLHPLEAKAGLDVRDLKPTYGDRLVLFGNIDVQMLAGTKGDVEEEIRTKVGFAKEGGGYMFHSDHSVPNNVSLDNYRFALEMLKKYGSYEG